MVKRSKAKGETRSANGTFPVTFPLYRWSFMDTHEFSIIFSHGFPYAATKVAVAKVAKLQETAARRLANERIGLMIFVIEKQ